ncbi:MAG: hypothetical protein NTZ46_11445 [Verrucomicrobia bacterium]|nr:hypothetical protein [Verrucomicrobiota bacterium]
MSDPFKIPHAELPDERKPSEAIIRILHGAVSEGIEISLPQIHPVECSAEWQQGMLKIANNAWRAMTKMIDKFSGEVKEEFQGVAKPVDGILRGLKELGFTIKGHTGDPYDEGMFLKVIAAEPTAGISRARVKETFKPTIRYNSKILQPGEIILEIPLAEKTDL